MKLLLWFTRDWGLSLLVAVSLIVFVHSKIFADPQPTTIQLREYLKNNRLQVGEESIDGYRQVYYSYDGVVVYITEGNINHISPEASGSKVVWLEELPEGRHVFVYDVLTKQKTRLTFAGTNQNPHIDSDCVVWESWTDNAWQIMLFDGREIRQISFGEESVRARVQGDKISYAQKISPSMWRIQLYTISTGRTETVQEVPSNQAYPRFMDGQVRPGPYMR